MFFVSPLITIVSVLRSSLLTIEEYNSSNSITCELSLALEILYEYLATDNAFPEESEARMPETLKRNTAINILKIMKYLFTILDL